MAGFGAAIAVNRLGPALDIVAAAPWADSGAGRLFLFSRTPSAISQFGAGGARFDTRPAELQLPALLAGGVGGLGWRVAVDGHFVVAAARGLRPGWSATNVRGTRWYTETLPGDAPYDDVVGVWRRSPRPNATTAASFLFVQSLPAPGALPAEVYFGSAIAVTHDPAADTAAAAAAADVGASPTAAGGLPPEAAAAADVIFVGAAPVPWVPPPAAAAKEGNVTVDVNATAPPPNSGWAYLYRRGLGGASAGTFGLVQVIWYGDLPAASPLSIGGAVAASPSYLALAAFNRSAPSSDPAAAAAAAGVWVVPRNATGHGALSSAVFLPAPAAAAAAGLNFGAAIALVNDSVLVVGAPDPAPPSSGGVGAGGYGAVYVYEVAGGVWTMAAAINASSFVAAPGAPSGLGGAVAGDAGGGIFEIAAAAAGPAPSGVGSVGYAGMLRRQRPIDPTKSTVSCPGVSGGTAVATVVVVCRVAAADSSGAPTGRAADAALFDVAATGTTVQTTRVDFIGVGVFRVAFRLATAAASATVAVRYGGTPLAPTPLTLLVETPPSAATVAGLSCALPATAGQAVACTLTLGGGLSGAPHAAAVWAAAAEGVAWPGVPDVAPATAAAATAETCGATPPPLALQVTPVTYQSPGTMTFSFTPRSAGAHAVSATFLGQPFAAAFADVLVAAPAVDAPSSRFACASPVAPGRVAHCNVVLRGVGGAAADPSAATVAANLAVAFSGGVPTRNLTVALVGTVPGGVRVSFVADAAGGLGVAVTWLGAAVPGPMGSVAQVVVATRVTRCVTLPDAPHTADVILAQAKVRSSTSSASGLDTGSTVTRNGAQMCDVVDV